MGKSFLLVELCLGLAKLRGKRMSLNSLELSKIFVKIGLTFSVVDFKNSIN